VAGSCEYRDEPSGSGATELVSYYLLLTKPVLGFLYVLLLSTEVVQ
jgi:hypothetical protein